MIELEERRSRERGLFNSISGNGVNLRKSATTNSRSFNMLCTGPNRGPSRGATSESGKSVVLRNWWSYCTVPRETAENSIYDEISAASAYWQNHSNPPLKPLEFYLVKFDLDNFNSCCPLAVLARGLKQKPFCSFVHQTLDFMACVIATFCQWLARQALKGILSNKQSLLSTEYSRAPNFLASSLGSVSSLLSVRLILSHNLARLHNGACAPAWY